MCVIRECFLKIFLKNHVCLHFAPISENITGLIQTKHATFFILNFMSFLLMYRFLCYEIILGWKNVKKSQNFGKKSTLFEKTEINMKITNNFFLTTLIRKIMKFWSTLVILACIGQISTNFLSIFYKTTGLIKTNPPHQFSQLKLHKLPIYGKVFVLPKYYRSYR